MLSGGQGERSKDRERRGKRLCLPWFGAWSLGSAGRLPDRSGGVVKRVEG